MPRANCKHIQRLLRERAGMSRAMTFITSDVVPAITPADKLQRTLSGFASIDVS